MPENFWRGNWHGSQSSSSPHHRAREIVRPTGGILRGFVPSRKNGRLVHHEGLLERDTIALFEAHHRIAQYREQPLALQYPDGPRLRRYTPDFEVVLDTGETVLVEVKPVRSLQAAEVGHKLACIAAHMARTARAFLVLDNTVIRQEPRLSNLRQILQHADHLMPTAAAVAVALRQWGKHFPMPYQQVQQALATLHLRPANLLLMGYLWCDLDVPFSPATELHLMKEENHAWFCLSQAHGF